MITSCPVHTALALTLAEGAPAAFKARHTPVACVEQASPTLELESDDDVALESELDESEAVEDEDAVIDELCPSELPSPLLVEEAVVEVCGSSGESP